MTKTSASVTEVQALWWLDVEAEVKFKLRGWQNRGGSLRGTVKLPRDQCTRNLVTRPRRVWTDCRMGTVSLECTRTNQQATTSMCMTQTWWNFSHFKMKMPIRRNIRGKKKKIGKKISQFFYSCPEKKKRKKKPTTDHLSSRCLSAAPACSGHFPMIHH